jgi:hypothetical protein
MKNPEKPTECKPRFGCYVTDNGNIVVEFGCGCRVEYTDGPGRHAAVYCDRGCGNQVSRRRHIFHIVQIANYHRRDLLARIRNGETTRS